jgi:hypothetical protein
MANRYVGDKVLIANHLETGNRSQIIFITLLLRQVLGFAVRFTSLSKLCKNVGPSQASIACFSFASSNCNLQHHILSTGEVALRHGNLSLLPSSPCPQNNETQISFPNMNCGRIYIGCKVSLC